MVIFVGVNFSLRFYAKRTLCKWDQAHFPRPSVTWRKHWSMMAAPIQSLLNEICASEDPIEELKNLRTAVLSTSVSGLRQAVSGARLEIIFGLLNTNDKWVLIVLSQQAQWILQTAHWDSDKWTDFFLNATKLCSQPLCFAWIHHTLW